jgi:hypothetical protein
MSKKKKSKKRGHIPSMAEIRKPDYVTITPPPSKKPPRAAKSKTVTDVNGMEWTPSQVNQMSRMEQEARFKN